LDRRKGIKSGKQQPARRFIRDKYAAYRKPVLPKGDCEPIDQLLTENHHGDNRGTRRGTTPPRVGPGFLQREGSVLGAFHPPLLDIPERRPGAENLPDVRLGASQRPVSVES
jgi:hypothetical protein